MDTHLDFKNKNVLITGHTGFKGSWLAVWLKLLGARVTGYALAPLTGRDNFVLSNLGGRITDIRGDIRDMAKLEKTIERARPEFVFHLAAQPLVGTGYTEPRETFDVNIMGTVNVLECCRKSPDVRAMIICTSDKCYKNTGSENGYDEDAPLGGDDPYSASKAGAEIVANAYYQSFFADGAADGVQKAVASVRAGNVFGGGDWRMFRLLPDCIRFLEKKKPIPVRNPRAVRPWQYVLEPLYGYLLLAQKMTAPGFSGGWNFGPGGSGVMTVQELVEQVIAAWGGGDWTDVSELELFKEKKVLTLNAARARGRLGWQPALSVERAIRETVQWYQKSAAKQDVYEYNCGLIQEYMQKAGQ